MGVGAVEGFRSGIGPLRTVKTEHPTFNVQHSTSKERGGRPAFRDLGAAGGLSVGRSRMDERQVRRVRFSGGDLPHTRLDGPIRRLLMLLLLFGFAVFASWRRILFSRIEDRFALAS
jgi:hypothetical protein